MESEADLGPFGDIFAYLRSDHTLDPRWEATQLSVISLPFPLALSWDRSRLVERMTCHRLLQPGVCRTCFRPY